MIRRADIHIRLAKRTRVPPVTKTQVLVVFVISNVDADRSTAYFRYDPSSFGNWRVYDSLVNYKANCVNLAISCIAVSRAARETDYAVMLKRNHELWEAIVSELENVGIKYTREPTINELWADTGEWTRMDSQREVTASGVYKVVVYESDGDVLQVYNL